MVQHGRYYLNDHGSLVAVDEPGYQAAVRGEERFAASVLGAFYAVGLAATSAKLVKSRSTHAYEVPARPSLLPTGQVLRPIHRPVHLSGPRRRPNAGNPMPTSATTLPT